MVVIDLKRDEGEISHDFVDYFYGLIDLSDGEYVAALTQGSIMFSWDNIKSEWNNNHFKYLRNGEWKTVIFKDGNYTVSDFNNRMYEEFKAKNDEECPIIFDEDPATRRIIIALEDNYEIDLTEGNFYELIGFENKTYKEPINIAKKESTNRGIIQYLLHCSIIDGHYLNGVSTDVIYSFYPQNAKTGDILNLGKNKDPIYLPVNVKRIHQIQMYLTDQNNNTIDLNKTPVFYQITIKKKYQEVKIMNK